MNTLNKTLMMAMTLAVASTGSAMATDHEVTIRLMQMNQHTQQQVLNQIELPEYANDDARAMQREQIRETLRTHQLDQEQASLGEPGSDSESDEAFYERDRDRARVQDRANQLQNELEQQQVENQLQQQQELHEHIPGGNQNGPGRQ